MTNAPGRLHYFALLTAEQQVAAIRRLAADGWTDYAIARATQLSVEQVRRVVGEARGGVKCDPRIAFAPVFMYATDQICRWISDGGAGIG